MPWSVYGAAAPVQCVLLNTFSSASRDGKVQFGPVLQWILENPEPDYWFGPLIVSNLGPDRWFGPKWSGSGS
jgi:hypothetical protein